MRKVAFIAILAALMSIGWLYWQQYRPVPFVVSGFVEGDEIRVGSRVGGRVAEILVAEGSTVTTGTALFTIDPYDLQQRLAEAEAVLVGRQREFDRLKAGYRKEEIEQARARRDATAATLAKLQAGPRPAEIQIAREELNQAQADFDLAQSEFDRISKLRESGQAGEVEYEKVIRALKSSKARMAAGKQQLALLEEGTRAEDLAEARAALVEKTQALQLMEKGYRPEDVAKAEAEVAAAEARVAAIRVSMKELTVVSPCDCVVENIDLRPGDLVPKDAPSVALLDMSRLWVRAYVPEARLGQVKNEQKVFMQVDGFPDERFGGHVSFISREGEFTPKNIQTPEERSKQVFRIKVMLDEGLGRLRIGMAADVLLDEANRP